MNPWEILLTVLSIGVIVVSVLPVALNFRRPDFDILNPRYLFCAYYALQLAVYPIAVVFSPEGFRYLSRTDNDLKWLCLASVVSLAAMIVFQVVYELRIWRAFTAEIPRPPRLDHSRISLVVVAGIPIALYSIYSAYFANGGLGGYMNAFVAIRYGTSGDARGFVFYLATAFVYMIAIVGFVGAISSRRRALMVISVGLFVLAVLSSIMTGYRGVVVITLLSGLAFYHYRIKRLMVRRFAVIFVALLLVVSLFGMVRVRVEERSAGVADGALAHVDFARSMILRTPGLEMVAITMREIIEGHQNFVYFGPALYEAATIPVPRAYWSGKPTPQSMIYGQRFMDYYLYLRDGALGENTGGISMTIVSYLYWQMGIVAVLGGMALLAIGFRIMVEYHAMYRTIESVSFAYVVMYPLFMKFAEAPQDAVNSLVLTATIVIPIILFCWRHAAVPLPRERVGAGRV